MKIRIKGNSVRYRLTRPDVKRLSEKGYLEEHTMFGEKRFEYALQCIEEGDSLRATFVDNTITLLVPWSWVEGWEMDERVGFSSDMPLTETDNLSLLLEKDFTCLETTTEDQADHYENPNKFC